MNVSWKVLRTSIAMSACLGLLAACQDRGQFHSKKWTKAELAKNLAAKPPAEQHEQTGTPANTEVTSGGQTPVETGTPGTPPGFSKPDPAKEQPAPTSPNPNEPKKGTGHSEGHLLFEELQERNAFIDNNNKLMQTIDPLAVKTFKGVTAIVTNPRAVFTIGLDVAVQMGNDLRYVAVSSSPISYLEADAKPIQLKAIVKEGLDEDARKITLNDQQLSIFAVCSDLRCSEVHVRITAETGNSKAVLAMVLAPQGNVYLVKNSNLKDQLVDFKTFAESSKTDANNKDERDDQNKTGDLPATVNNEHGRDGEPGKDDNGGSSDISKKTDRDQQNGASDAKNAAQKKAAADKAAADKAAADKAAADKANTDKATADKAAADAAKAAAAAKAVETAKSAAAVIAPPSTSAKKSVVFNANANGQQDSVPVLDMKPAARPLQVVQDPGQFKFEQPAPGIFGDTKNLASNAVDGKDKTPAASTDDAKVEETATSKPAAEASTSSN